VWEDVKPHKRVDVAKLRFLSVDEAKLLIQACPTDFRSLVEGALYTGCRYGELTAMGVDAFQSESKTLLIADSKSGKPRYVFLGDDGVKFFTNLTSDRKRK
jgi:integrase